MLRKIKNNLSIFFAPSSETPENPFDKPLESCVKYYKSQPAEDYIAFLTQLFLLRKIDSTRYPFSHLSLNTQKKLDKKIKKYPATLLNEAIVKKLTARLTDQPKYDTSAIFDHVNLYLLDHVPHSTSRMITWVHEKMLKESIFSLSILQIQFLSGPSIQYLGNIMKLFNITRLKIESLGEVKFHHDSMQWKAIMHLITGMKEVDLDRNNLTNLSDLHLRSLAQALPSVEKLNIGHNFNKRKSADKAKLHDADRWYNFIKILLLHPQLTTLTIDDFDRLFALHEPEKQKELLKQFSLSNVSSLVLAGALFHPDFAERSNPELNNVIAQNYRRAALSLNNGLQYLVAYTIWNNPKTHKEYEKKKGLLPAELDETVKRLSHHGVFTC